MENEMNLYCALIHCAAWIEDLKHGRPVEFLTPCYFCKYMTECKGSVYKRLRSLADNMELNISPLVVGDNETYAVRKDLNGDGIFEKFNVIKEVVPWNPHFGQSKEWR